MNNKGFVFIHAEYTVQKAAGSITLLAQHSPLAEARVNKQAEVQGKVGFMREVANALGPVVFLQSEVIVVKSADNRALLIPYRREDVYYFDVSSNGRPLRCFRTQ